MKAFLTNFAAVLILLAAPASAEEKPAPAPTPLSEEAIRNDAFKRKIDGPIKMPEETLEERAKRINGMIRKLGYTEEQLKVTVDPRVATFKPGLVRLKDVPLALVFKYTFDAYRITAKITKGHIAIVPLEEVTGEGK